MPSPAFAVIGAGFGDEGKGLAVDALTRAVTGAGRAATVVRSNGGAQAGHGVETPGGLWHVFHHVGSGSFAGAATHLSRFFVAHPMMALPEIAELEAMGVTPRISIDPRAPVTTPWDMMLNQAAETFRGKDRHGSCGMGFGETLERTGRGPALAAADLHTPGLAAKLRAVRDDWGPMRLEELRKLTGGAEDASAEILDLMCSQEIFDRFLADCSGFTSLIDLASDRDLSSRGTILFEGAQGLRLDQDFGDFPHVTRSNTGLRNMIEIAREAGIGEIQPLYMTRAYATRHGAGPFPHEGRIDSWARVVDRTNAPNAWQGSLRVGPLDIDALCGFIARDIALAEGSGIHIQARLGVTCLDQIEGRPQVVRRGLQGEIAKNHLPGLLAREILPIGLISQGPNADMVAIMPGLRSLFGETLAQAS